ncbi:hypothetical protein [Rhodohalobacter mucosus]|uniref:Uncharacterized protein n=1 Tax=Rhodohalobacter mucosus TaxID=2079485 RepID=A0A316TRW6_9BACT|nr:hypothetical protein [Rhodohalobacter mucosus]PWN06371.1 hypothetical protein DDZ15_11155 [Rhodohalobacter mucosus]
MKAYKKFTIERLADEIIELEKVANEVAKHPCLQPTIDRWKSEKVAQINESLLYDKIVDFDNESIYMVSKYLLMELQIRLLESKLISMKADLEKTMSSLIEHFELQGSLLDRKNKLVLGGLFIGKLNNKKQIRLYEELIDYTLDLAGAKKENYCVDLITQLLDTNKVSSYLNEIEIEFSIKPNQTRDTLLHIINNKKVAVTSSKDKSLSKPLRDFAKMVSELNQFSNS